MGRKILGRLQRVKDSANQRIVNAANFVAGYVQEQLFTTLNSLPFDLAAKYIPESPETEHGCCNAELMEKEDRIDRYVNAGATVGAIQDLASLGLSVSYLCGNDSRLAHIAAGVVATKIGMNILSLAAQGIYLRASRNKSSLQCSSDGLLNTR